MGTAALGARRLFGSDAVGALSVAAFEGFHGRSPLLPECAAQKAADRVGLPSGRLREFLQGDAAGPFQQIDDLGRFAAAEPACATQSRRETAAGRSASPTTPRRTTIAERRGKE